MDFEIKLKLLLWKHYFDTGMGHTNYFRYFLYLFAAGEIIISQNYFITALILVAWGIFAFIYGWAFYHYNWKSAEIEVINRVDPFVKEVREKFI